MQWLFSVKHSVDSRTGYGRFHRVATEISIRRLRDTCQRSDLNKPFFIKRNRVPN